MARKRTAAAQNDNADDDALEGAPLFDSTAEIAYVTVSRDDPDEGYVGRVPASATERDILKKFGGGSFTLSARNPSGKPVKGGHRSLSIGGDPIFQSRAAELKWKRAQGLDDDRRPAAASGEKPMSMAELLILMDKQAEKARADSRDMFLMQQQLTTQSHQRQLEMMREEATRRDRDAAERDARREREQKEQRERDREFMATMLQLVKSDAKAAGGADPVALLLKGVELAGTIKGAGGGEEGESDPVTALAANLPAILEHGARLVERGTAAARPAPNPKRGRGEDDDEEGVTLQGEIATKAKALVAKLEAEGKDPAAVMSLAMDVLLGQRRAAARGAAGKGKPARNGKPGKGPRAAAPAKPAPKASAKASAKAPAKPQPAKSPKMKRPAKPGTTRG